MTNTALDHRVELDDAELAVLLGLLRQRTARDGATLDTARTSLLRRRLVQIHDAELHLPAPLLAALLPLAAPTIAIASDGPTSTAALLGGLRDGWAGLALRHQRTWTVWAVPADDLGETLAEVLPDEATLVRLTRTGASRRVVGVELATDELRADPRVLDRLLREHPLSNPGPRATN